MFSMVTSQQSPHLMLAQSSVEVLSLFTGGCANNASLRLKSALLSQRVGLRSCGH